jgi:putative ABC transport system permease protein
MWRNYLTTALRHLARNRLYAAISIASLAVGFAVAVLAGVFLRHELTYDRFLPDYGRLYFLRQTQFAPAFGVRAVSNAPRKDFAADLKADLPGVEAVTRLQPRRGAVRSGATVTIEPDMAYADANLLQVLQLRVAEGDPATALAAPDSVVITRSVARRYFGDADPLDRTLTIGDVAQAEVGGASSPPTVRRITAVLEDLPDETHLKTQVFIPEPIVARGIPAAPQGDEASTFNQRALTYVRLAPWASVETANRALPEMVRRRVPDQRRLELRLLPLSELHLPRVKVDDPGGITPTGDRTLLMVAAGVGALILLTAAVNFVGLMTARAGQRAVEVGVRKAVGARPLDLAIQFLTETLVQVAVAFLIAVALAEQAAPPLGRLMGRTLSLDYIADARFLGELGLAALVVGLAAGAYPALVLARFRPVAALKGEVGPSGASSGVRQALVVAQFAILTFLLIVILTVWRQSRLAIYHASRLHGQPVVLVRGRPMCGTALEEQIRRLPGVEAATCSADTVFLNGGSAGTTRSVTGELILLQHGPVEPGFFEFYGLKPLAGRTFDPRRPADAPLWRDPAGSTTPVVLNAAAARTFGFASPQGAVGKTVRWARINRHTVDGGGRPMVELDSEVLGVTPDYAGTSREGPKPMIYWADPTLMTTLSAKIDGRRAPQVLRGIDRLWRQAGHEAPAEVRFFDDYVREAYRDVTILGAMIGACAAIAVGLAGAGLFALAAYTTERRTKEFGVRKAMGADALDIARLLLWQLSKPVLAAGVIAAPLGYLAARWWLQGFAERVTLGPATFLAVALTIVLIAWITVLTHTWRVARTRPVAALRYE